MDLLDNMALIWLLNQTKDINDALIKLILLIEKYLQVNFSATGCPCEL